MLRRLLRSLNGKMRKRGTVLSSPIAGRVVPLSAVSDETFATGMLGDGVAVIPTGNRVVAPADAKVEAIFPTGHAVALRTTDGMDVLFHLGFDTVKLQGRHFKVLAKEGDVVKRGDVLIEFDRAAIAFEGYDTTVPVLVRNTAEFSSLKGVEGKQVDELDPLIVLRCQ